MSAENNDNHSNEERMWKGLAWSFIITTCVVGIVQLLKLFYD
jgi:hypothetical protein